MLYALLLEGGKFYVGETAVGRSVEDMFVLHCVYLESWMSDFHPLDLYAWCEGDLDEGVLALMRLVGVANVRGGRWMDKDCVLPVLPPPPCFPLRWRLRLNRK